MAHQSISSSKHFVYASFVALWKIMRDSLKDESQVKQLGTEYLPATSTMQEDGMSTGQPGRLAYDAYKLRAVWHDVPCEAVEGLLGMMHKEPPSIQLPKQMEPLLESATKQNESLEQLLKRINRQQLEVGRVGIFADVEDGAVAGTLPFLMLYHAENITNWNEFNFRSKDRLDFVVLDESRFVVNKADYSWDKEQRYKLLFMGEDGKYAVKTEVDGTIEVKEGSVNGAITPTTAGNSLDEIPFTFCNVNDIIPEPQQPPLIGLAHMAFAAYRGEADYRQTLFMQGQDTLVVIGGILDGQEADGTTDGTELASTPETRTGAGSVINITDPQGDAQYIGVESKGLEEQRKAIENDLSRASSKGAKLADSAQKEAAETLKIRTAARGYTITNIALAGAAALEQSLRQIAKWIGANPDEVIVEPNLNFTQDEFAGQDLKALVESRLLGAPISYKTIHRIMRDRDLTELTYEEEIETIDSEGTGDE